MVLTRRTLSAKWLRLKLEEVFEEAGGCAGCVVPLPMYAMDGSQGNWLLPAPTRCPKGCHEKLAIIAAQLSEIYAIQRPPGWAPLKR